LVFIRILYLASANSLLASLNLYYKAKISALSLAISLFDSEINPLKNAIDLAQILFLVSSALLSDVKLSSIFYNNKSNIL